MGRMSFTQELKALVKASEGMDADGCWPGRWWWSPVYGREHTVVPEIGTPAAQVSRPEKRAPASVVGRVPRVEVRRFSSTSAEGE